MPRTDEKVMFELFREAGYDRHFRGVYFTERREHRREKGINRTISRIHVIDGFLDRGLAQEQVRRTESADAPAQQGARLAQPHWFQRTRNAALRDAAALETRSYSCAGPNPGSSPG